MISISGLRKVMPSVTEAGKYALAMGGTAGGAAAQFLLSLVLLRRLPAAEFSRFVFLLLVAQFLWSIMNALFVAPLAHVLAERKPHGLLPTMPPISLLNQAGTAIISGLALPIALALDASFQASLLYAGVVASGSLRQFGRAMAYCHGKQFRVAISDAIYMTALVAGTAWIVVNSQPHSDWAYAAYFVSGLVSLIPFARRTDFWADPQLAQKSFKSIWRKSSRWSLLGVIATTATANAHSYMVTLFLGPQAFVPIAASGTLTRPCIVALNALSELERSRLAIGIAQGSTAAVKSAMWHFRMASIIVWLFTIIAMCIVLAFFPYVFFNRSYDLNAVVIGSALWSAILLARALYFPEAILLQAHGAFSPLAIPMLWAAPVSIGSVSLLLVLAPPVWSLGGIVLGEFVAAALIFRAVRTLPQTKSSSSKLWAG
ncbi:hypothetical protein [Novosphingobium album (ex Liu et al. 2023)]|uniref:Lipopolysaccharide biosynthesis protein n=1 Tax=Novosphingobium album (ex Liu et al. 2023) TaxID=3031130 RepID=A0ABT5WQJ6_9SPHN|nr:hypothetical protein [Novosphingobium album (ex Liu et al. 2023)]MDE8652294.1 hypothetical protein [Novosphingobium album (ex Liu et al. 2023)]